MYRRVTAYSSLVSNISAPTRRMVAPSFGKILMRTSRRFTSRLKRSSGMVLAIWVKSADFQAEVAQVVA
jgi:hypothetical protein